MELTLAPTNNKSHIVWDDYVPILKNGSTYTVYLTEQIASPSSYDQLHYVLSTAESHETILFVINNGGGVIDSGFMLINAIKDSKAKTIAKVTGMVASVATIITLACDEIIIDDYISFMIHNYSLGSSGHSKGHELKAMIDFTNSQLNTVFTSIYLGFLTETEMREVIDGKDLWMGTEEVKIRWNCKITNDMEKLKEYVASL